MTLFDSTAYEVSKETFEYAKNIAVNSEDEFSRKRIYESLICLRTLAEYFISEGYQIDLDSTLHKIMPLNEELECNDLRGNGRCIDVRTVVNGKYILIPKAYYKYNVLPDLFAVAKYNADTKTVNILGCIEPLQIEKQRQNEKYFIMDTSQIMQPFQIEDRIKLVKNPRIADQDHGLYASYFIDYCDGVLSDENKKKLFGHLFECKGCREKFANYYEFEQVAKNSSKYPEILQDQMLNIVGAAGVEKDKYKNFEEITIEIDKEPDTYAEDEEETKEDPLQVLYGNKSLNSEVFNNIQQKAQFARDRKTKSLLDSVMAEIPKLPVPDVPKQTSALPQDNTDNTNKSNDTKGKINPLLYEEDYSDGIVEPKTEPDYIEELVSSESDLLTDFKDEAIFEDELNPNAEITTPVDEMKLLDIQVSPDVSDFANYKQSVSNVNNTEDYDLIIVDEEENSYLKQDNYSTLEFQTDDDEVIDVKKDETGEYKTELKDDDEYSLEIQADDEHTEVTGSEKSGEYKTELKDDDEYSLEIQADDEHLENIGLEKINASKAELENSENLNTSSEDIKVADEEDKYDNVDEQILVHFDAEELDIVDEKVYSNADKSEQIQITADDNIMENINNELTLINDEENKKDDHDDDLTVIDNDENNAEVMTSLDDEVDEIDVKSEKNQGIDLAEIKIDFGDNNPLFSNSSDDNLSMESDIDLKLDKDTSGEDDLFNFGDIDLSLDFEENPKIGESTELSGRGLGSEVGTVIEDMKDSVNSFSVSEGYQEYNAPQAEEDDEIILIDEHNQPISNSDDAGNNTEKDNNENKTDSFVDDDDFQIITDENDDTTSFVRPISVSDLNNQFIEEEDDSKTEIDEIDDEIVFVDSNSDEDVNFVRPASINYEEITENNENDTKEKSEVITEENDEIPSNPIPVERPKTVLYDEDGFEIESESSEVEVPEVENLHEYGVSQANEEPETVEYDTDESEYDETYTDETEENDYDESEEVEEDGDVEEESQNKNSFIKKAAIIGIICLIGLGSVGGGLFFYMKKVKQDQMKNIAALNSLNEENTAETDGLTPDEVQSDNENNQENVNSDNPENPENPEQASENQQKLPEPPAPKSIEEVKPKDMNQAMTDAFSNNAAPIKITKLSWAVAPYIAADNDFKAFLQTSGRAIQTEVKKNLIAVHDNTYAENTKVQIEIKDGAADNITISKSSGSKQIDEIVLQSVKDYMTNAQLPQLSETTVDAIKNANGSYNFKITLSINF